MAGFDAEAWRAAREPWTYSDQGRTWTARPVSAEAVLAAQLELQAASAHRARRIMRRLFRLAFPYRLSMRWRGDPVALIEALPLPGWEAVLRSFFEYATGRPMPDLPRAPSLPTSSAPSPQAPAEALLSSPTP